MSYSNTGPTGHGASHSASNSQSFSSRITSFADIADVSIHHLQYDQGSDRAQRRFTAPPQAYAPPAVASPVATQYTHDVRRDTYGGVNTSFGSAQQPQHYSNSSPHLRMTGSAVSLQSEFDGEGRRLYGRESMVSMQSYYDPPPTQQQQQQQRYDTYKDNQTTYSRPTSWMAGSQPGYEPIISPPQGYEPVTSPVNFSRSRSRGSRTRGSFLPSFGFGHNPIPEEEHDMTELLPSAASIGRSPGYDAVPTHDDAGLTFDPTSTLGPSTLKNNLFVKKLQEEEAKGHLTGGLGSGWKTGTRLLGSDLLRGPSQMQRSLTRRLTSRSPRHQSDALKEIGQQEADRRGEIVEVILDEPAGVDLSNAVGPAGLSNGTESSDAKPPERQKKTEVFFPQPNWKPFSMRWPYLSVLIFLSVALAVLQEFVYRRSRRKPLIKFTSPDEVSAPSYFAVKFLPTIISVTYGVLWQVTELEVKRLEAYYQLSKPGGALAAESINVDYITSRSITRPFRAFQRGHYAVAICSLGTNLAVSLVPTLGAACILLTPDRDKRLADPGLEKSVVISATFSKLLTATLSLCAVCALILFFLLQTRRTGLLSDVKGIAGLASMAVVCHILMDFKDMDTARHENIHQRLRYNRYVLQNSALAPHSENTAASKRATDGSNSSRYQHTDVSEGSHPLMMRAAGYVSFVVGIAAFIGLMIAVLFTKASVVTDKAPWLVTAMAVGIKLGWSVLDTDMRMMEPFYILSRRHAPARVLTLDYTAMPFAYMPWKAYSNGDTIMFLVGIGSVIAEVLTVLSTSLAAVDGRDFLTVVKNHGESGGGVKDSEGAINAGQETVTSFWFSLAVAGVILVYMAGVASLVYARRRHRFLPRQPNTIASVLAYIHQSKMLYDFVGMSKMNSADIAVKLDQGGKTYGLGWFEGRDGQSHCGVDEEELTGSYKRGMVPGEINKPWTTRWDTLD